MANSELDTMLTLYHEAAQGLDGVFVLASIAPDSGHVMVQQFAVGDVDAMATEALRLAATSNVYMPPALLRSDLEPGRRGTKKDIVAVLGVVIDDDRDRGRACTLPHGFDPSVIVVTSGTAEVNRHVHYIFSLPLFTVEAAPLAELLHRKCGGDAGTKDIAHVWRLPGTLNYPSEVKIKRGRPEVPQEVHLAGGTLLRVDPGKLRQALEDMPDPCAATPTSYGRGTADRHRLVERLPGRLMHLINTEGDADRSAHCFRTMMALMEHGLSNDDVRTIAINSPFARKFAERGDLDAEIERVRRKSNMVPDATSPIREPGDVAPSASRRSQADMLIDMVREEGAELFHSPDGSAYVDVLVEGHRETWPVRSSGYARWLRRLFFTRTNRGLNSTAMATALGVFEARSHYDGTERQVHLRVAAHLDHIYLDLGDRSWRAVEISAEGWRIAEASPVRFRRTKGMLALPEPAPGGAINELREYLHISDAGFVLVISWLLAALRGRGPYPVLSLNGEQGSGKSFIGDLLRQLIDPSAASLRVLPGDVRDLYVSAINGHVMGFDNLSSISADISDALCRLATGGGFSVRALFTDADEVLFHGQRPIIMTSINDVADRSDLADRLVLVRLAAIPEHERTPEDDLRGAFEAARPRILGALLDMVSHGLKTLPEVRLDGAPRMADYARWIRACETAVWEAGTHMQVYNANRRDAVEIVLEADPVAVAVRRLMEAHSQVVTNATELLNVLTTGVSDDVRRSKEWPRAANALSGRLIRLAPALRRVGVEIAFDRTGEHRTIRIERRLNG